MKRECFKRELLRSFLYVLHNSRIVFCINKGAIPYVLHIDEGDREDDVNCLVSAELMLNEVKCSYMLSSFINFNIRYKFH